MELKTWLFTD